MDRNQDGIQELDGALRDRLLRLMASESVADCITVKARVEHGVRSADILQPTLAVLLEGEKDVRCPDGEWVLRPGLLNVMCAGGWLQHACCGERRLPVLRPAPCFAVWR